MTGKGVTVAIVDAYASPTMLSDANQYAKVTGDKPFAAGQYTQDLASDFTDTAPNQCDAAGWYGEQTLDVESVHGMAPTANVVYVGAASCTDQDLGDALALIVDNHLASIVSDSWGEPADSSSEVPVYEEIFQAGAAEGIGFFFSSGDSGYENPSEDPGSDMQQADAQQAAGHALGFANPVIYQRYHTSAFRDVTDHPFGIRHLAEVRTNYTDPSTKKGPLLTYLRTLGVNGEGAAALPAVRGYDDATGVGSPARYIQSF